MSAARLPLACLLALLLLSAAPAWAQEGGTGAGQGTEEESSTEEEETEIEEEESETEEEESETGEETGTPGGEATLEQTGQQFLGLGNALSSRTASAQLAGPRGGREADPRLERLLSGENTLAGVYKYSLAALPEDDLSWVALRSVVGPTLWDGAARFLPDAILHATLPVNAGDVGTLGLIDLDPVPERSAAADADQQGDSAAGNPLLTIGSVLGTITYVILLGGTVLLGVFAVFYVLQAVWGYRNNKSLETAGWGSARLVASLGFLIPIGGNTANENTFCVIQGVLVVAAQIGIGFANMAWDAAMGMFTAAIQDDAAAEQAVREILYIDAEAEAARAVAVGVCTGLMKGWTRQLTQQPNAGLEGMGGHAGPNRPRTPTYARACGGIEPTGDMQARLDGLARAYGPAGEDIHRLVSQIHQKRTEALEELRDFTEDLIWDTVRIDELRKPAEPLMIAAASAQGYGLLNVGPESSEFAPTTDSNGATRAEEVQVVQAPAVTHALWWLFSELVGPNGAGGCLREWGGDASDGDATLGGLIQKAVQAGELGVENRNELSDGTVAQWNLGAMARAASPAAGSVPYSCHYVENKPFGKAVNKIYNAGNDRVAGELAGLIRGLYREQLKPLSGDLENDGMGRRGWLLAGSVYWHIQVARRVNTILRELATPKVAGPTGNEHACGRDATGCPNVHAWNMGFLVGLSSMHASHAVQGAPPLEYNPQDFSVYGETDGAIARKVSIDEGVVLWLVEELYRTGYDNAPLSRMMWTGFGLTEIGMKTIVPSLVLSWVPFIGDGIGSGLVWLSMALIGVGLILAVWLPTLPLIAWVASVWAWLVSVVLGLLAAPLWALAHAIPDGHGPLSGYSRNGYQLMMFTMVRPLFLVAGLLLAMTMAALICKIGAVLFSATVGGYAAAAHVEGAGWLHSLAVVGVALVLWVFIVWLVTKTFTLCHELPDRVFEWVGGTKSLGDSEMLDRGRAFLTGMVGANVAKPLLGRGAQMLLGNRNKGGAAGGKAAGAIASTPAAQVKKATPEMFPGMKPGT